MAETNRDVAPVAPIAADNDDTANLVSDNLLSVLSKNLAGTWRGSQRSVTPVWGFFVPSDPTLTGQERSKAASVTCLVCHAIKTAELHASLDTKGVHAIHDEESDVNSWFNFNLDEKTVKHKFSFAYDASKGNTSLKQHAVRYHRTLYDALIGKVEHTRPAKRAAPNGAGDADPTAGAHDTVGNFFRSSKKIQKNSLRGRIFLRLLTMLIVFARLPFNIVMNPAFHAFVWFMDPALPWPTRSDVTGKHLPALRQETELALKQFIKGVHGVSVTFDLWMSKKTDDILTLDVHFITEDWKWHNKHLGLVAMNGQTTGTAIAWKLQQLFEKFNLMEKLYATVFDGQANLRTAKEQLRNMHTNRVACVALQLPVLYFTTCLAHLVSSACNGAVLLIKREKFQQDSRVLYVYQVFDIGKTLEKLQSCITWTKKSSKGWEAFKAACNKFAVTAVAFITPVKTRFTSTWRMLAGILEREQVVNHLYGEMHETEHLRDRHPQPVEWSQAKALVKELDYPCKVVLKAQDQGHWYLSDAMHRMVALYKHMRDGLLDMQVGAGVEAISDEPPTRMEQDSARLSGLMKGHIKAKIEPAVQPFMYFLPERGNEVLAVLLDPRFCKGSIFRSLADNADAAKALFKQYTESVLVPAALNLKTYSLSLIGETEERNRNTPEPENAAAEGEDCMESDEDDDAGPTDARVIRAAIERENKSFRKDKNLPLPIEGNMVDPLKWWAAHAKLYPLLVPLVRVAFSCPGSQVECERVFSLAGLLTAALRNRMSPERLADVVFISKNLDLAAELKDMLGNYYGLELYNVAADSFKSGPESADAIGLMKAESGSETIDWGAVESMLNEAEPAFEEM